MNPLKNLIGIKFKDLDAYQLLEVMQNYCDANKYDYDIDAYFENLPITKERVIEYFESNFHYLFELENYFKFWTK
jgi:hypothetical protein